MTAANRITRLLQLVVALTALMGATSSAKADRFTFYNDGDFDVWVTYTMQSSLCPTDNPWRNMGWWKAAPKRAVVLNGSDSVYDKYIYIQVTAVTGTWKLTGNKTWYTYSVSHEGPECKATPRAGSRSDLAHMEYFQPKRWPPDHSVSLSTLVRIADRAGVIR